MAGQGACSFGGAACIAADLAAAFVEGRLAADQRAAVERRIAACARCRAIVVDVGRKPARGAVLVDASGEVVGELRQVRRGDGGLAPGDTIGRYVVERPLGEGGMGVVSLARDPELHRPVVIKLVHPDRAGEDSDEFEARLRREAQAMARVSHANVVQIFDIGRRGERVFLAMEFVDGHTLDEWLRARPRAPGEILGVIGQAGAGLAAAHRAGLIHRDFKPSNVLVGRDGTVKVTDFGLARAAVDAAVAGDAAADAAPGATRRLRAASALAAAPGPQPPPGSAPGSPRSARRAASRPSGVHAVLTEVNAVLGTPAYMAPEQAAGAAVDARVDQFALAVTLLDALLAQRPSRRGVGPSDLPEVIAAALDRAGAPPPVAAAISRALDRDPAARFATVDDFLRGLAPPPGRARSRRAAVAVLGAVLCAAALAAWLALRPGPAVVERTVAPECAAQAPARWTGEPRAKVVAALAAAPRPFAAWDAERVAAAVDAAVDALAGDEVAHCRAGSAAGSDADRSCVAERGAALDAAVAALSASPAPADPWPLIHPIAACDAPAAAGSGSSARVGAEGEASGSVASAGSGLDVVALRSELASASPGRARAIADKATRAAGGTANGAATQGSDASDRWTVERLAALAADALEAAGLASLAAGDAAAADADFEKLATAGERASDDAVRGRALLHLIATAQWRGNLADAGRAVDQLHAILARHREAPRDTLAVALAEGNAFTDLGDVAAAFAAWDRARDAAAALAEPDGVLAAALGRAWAMHALRFDLDGARAAVAQALEVAVAASAAIRARGLAVSVDLALAARSRGLGRPATADRGAAGAPPAAGDRGAAAMPTVGERGAATAPVAGDRGPGSLAAADGAAVRAALDEAERLDPEQAASVGGRLRALRVQALLGDRDGALAGLAGVPAEAPLAAARIAAARGELLLAAGRAAEAADALDRVASPGRRGGAAGRGAGGAALPTAERIALALAAYDAHLASGDRAVRPTRLLEPLHPRAPVRARFELLDARHASAEQPVSRAYALNAALGLLDDAGAAPVALGELRWQLAELCMAGTDCRGHATAARDAFQAAGRTDDAAAIDRWLAAQASGAPRDGSAANSPRRELPGPQP